MGSVGMIIKVKYLLNVKIELAKCLEQSIQYTLVKHSKQPNFLTLADKLLECLVSELLEGASDLGKIT